jgi:hypothetical protein
VNRENQPIEFGAFNRQLLAAGRRERVVPGTAVVLGRAPLGFRPTFEEQALQGWLEGAFAHFQHIAGDRSEPLSDAIAVKWSYRARFED